MIVAKCKVKCPRESSQHHFVHFLDVCLSTLSEFSPAIQEIDVLNKRPSFAGHTSLWANLSHWICLLHRSWFQDNPQHKTAEKILHEIANISTTARVEAVFLTAMMWHLCRVKPIQIQPMKTFTGSDVNDTPPKTPNMAWKLSYFHKISRKYVTAN